MDISILQVALKTDQDLILARQRTKEVATRAGLALQDQTRLITAVSELARNAVMYADGGKLRLSIIERDGRQYVEAVVSDNGRGIANLKSIFDETYHSKTGLGKGIAGSKRISDLFDIQTSDKGTTVVVGKLVPIAKDIITPKTVASWTKALAKTQPPSPIEQLQEQNQLLMQTLEELQVKSKELAERSEQLTRVSKHKDEFLANMSHEIRTPLNALIGLNNILARTELTEEQRRLVTLSREAGKSLLSLINDILDLSKIEAGKLTIEKVEFDIHALASTTVDIFSVQAQEKGLDLILSMDDSVPPYVVGDSTRIRQIIVNLLGNAIKFTESGKVEISFSGKRDEQDPARCTIRVEVMDTGPGISAEGKNNLFQSFVQLDGSITRQHGGTGLGLSICKHLVTLMHGQIGVRSQLKKGSTFWFELPLSIAPERTKGDSIAVGTAGDTAAPDLRNKLVLVAEDHPVNQLVTVTELQELGLEVHVANNGEEALQLVEENAYALIFMDCQMPILDGFAATRNLRANGVTVPVVAMTAHAQEGDRQRCLDAGMNDYISKPFEPDDLRRVVTRWLTISEEKPLFDLDRLSKRYRPAQLDKLMRAFIADIPNTNKQLTDASESRKFEAIAAVAHAFKGACGMLFVSTLAEIAHELESAAKQENVTTVDNLVVKLLEENKQAVAECERILRSLSAEAR